MQIVIMITTWVYSVQNQHFDSVIVDQLFVEVSIQLAPMQMATDQNSDRNRIESILGCYLKIRIPLFGSDAVSGVSAQLKLLAFQLI